MSSFVEARLRLLGGGLFRGVVLPAFHLFVKLLKWQPAILHFMEVLRREKPNSLVLDVSGEIDLYNAHILKDQLNDLAGQGGAVPVVIDLDGVDYIDSSGIGALISGKAALDKAGRRLGLCNLTGSVRSVMQMTRLLSFFQIFDSEEDALRILLPASASA